MKMNKVLLILIFFIFSSDFYAQKKCYEDSVDIRGYIVSECLRSSKYIDFNEKLMSEPGTGIILYRSSMQPFTGKCQGCFFNDKLWFQMELQSGKKNGPYIVNYKSGCPKEDGPDWDFGASTILMKTSEGRNILFGGRKSGHVYALDPDQKGKLLWSRKIGRGGFAGGVHWGMTIDSDNIYAPIADKNYINKYFNGKNTR